VKNLPVLQELATRTVEQVSVWVIIYNLFLSAVLSLILGWVYTRYGSALSNRQQFARNFLPITMTTMFIITIVKSSLALSLGLIGALSIIRFRTAIKEPEELSYLFLAIAVGMGIGANQAIITICVMGLGATFSIFIVAALTIPMELPGVSAARVGIVTAAILTMGNLAGVMSPIFIGSLTDFMGSYIPALSILALAPLTLVVAGVFLPETGQRGASRAS